MMKYTQITSPGNDMELLSLKAFNALKSADTILLNEKVSPALLLFASPECLIFDKINDLCDYLQAEKPDPKWNLVSVMASNKPFDGPAYKELLFFAQKGFSTEIIPGINLLNNLSSVHDFPLTQRGKNESFCVINCKETAASISHTVSTAAVSTAIIVLLNAGNQACQFIDIIAGCRKKDEPVLLITQNQSQKSIKTSLGKFFRSLPEHTHQFDLIIIGSTPSGMNDKTPTVEQVQPKVFDLA